MELPEIIEIDDAKWLVDNDELDPHLKRVYSTRGRVGKVCSLQRDAESLRWMGETKVKALPKWLVVAWEQVQSLAKKEGKLPVLMLHVPGTRDDEHALHVISREEHARLMAIMKEVDGLIQQVADLQATVEEPKEVNNVDTRELKNIATLLDRAVRGLRDVIRDAN